MHKGIAVSPGVVVGIAYRVDSVFGSSAPQTLASAELVPAEIERFDIAVSKTVGELEAFVTKVAQQLGPTEADIFKSHLQIVSDQTLIEKVHGLIETQRLTALSALQEVLQGYAASFARIEHDYYRERMTDVRDVLSKIGAHLTLQTSILPAGAGESPDGEEPVILVAHEILEEPVIAHGVARA